MKYFFTIIDTWDKIGVLTDPLETKYILVKADSKEQAKRKIIQTHPNVNVYFADDIVEIHLDSDVIILYQQDIT